MKWCEQCGVVAVEAKFRLCCGCEQDNADASSYQDEARAEWNDRMAQARYDRTGSY